MKYSPVLIFLYFSYAYATESTDASTEASTGLSAAAEATSTQVTSQSSSSDHHSKRTLDLTKEPSAEVTVTTAQDGVLTKKTLNVKDGMQRQVTDVHVGSHLLWTSPEHEKLTQVVCHEFKNDLLLVKLLARKFPEHPPGPVVPPVEPDDGSVTSSGELTAGPRPTTESPVSELAQRAFRKTHDKFVHIPLEDYESTLERFKERAAKDGATAESVANVTKDVRLQDGFTIPTMYIATTAIALILVAV